MLTKSYSELLSLQTFEERFEYLQLSGEVAHSTFGYNRIFNQSFYHSPEWRRTRNGIILRDNACDLGIADREIKGRVYIHHLNPITLEDVEEGSERLLDPNNLICVSFDTHNAIHFGTERTLPKLPTERVPGDTCPWR
jgi:hypothetical protein